MDMVTKVETGLWKEWWNKILTNSRTDVWQLNEGCPQVWELNVEKSNHIMGEPADGVRAEGSGVSIATPHRSLLANGGQPSWKDVRERQKPSLLPWQRNWWCYNNGPAASRPPRSGIVGCHRRGGITLNRTRSGELVSFRFLCGCTLCWAAFGNREWWFHLFWKIIFGPSSWRHSDSIWRNIHRSWLLE